MVHVLAVCSFIDFQLPHICSSNRNLHCNLSPYLLEPAVLPFDTLFFIIPNLLTRYFLDFDLAHCIGRFKDEEIKHNKPELPLPKELVREFRSRIREIQERPIRKVGLLASNAFGFPVFEISVVVWRASEAFLCILRELYE